MRVVEVVVLERAELTTYLSLCPIAQNVDVFVAAPIESGEKNKGKTMALSRRFGFSSTTSLPVPESSTSSYMSLQGEPGLDGGVVVGLLVAGGSLLGVVAAIVYLCFT